MKINISDKIWNQMYRYFGTTKTMLWSLKKVCRSKGYDEVQKELQKVNEDIFRQYTRDVDKSLYVYQKLWNQHSFQASFTVNALRTYVLKEKKNLKTLNLVDIGDSAGNHLKYIEHLMQNDNVDFNAVSVNLDPVAVKKIQGNGGRAILCRAEEYVPETNIDCYLSYEMVEHLHNPSQFFYRLAKLNKGKYMIITVPYMKQSQVGLRNSMGGGIK